MSKVLTSLTDMQRFLARAESSADELMVLMIAGGSMSVLLEFANAAYEMRILELDADRYRLEVKAYHRSIKGGSINLSKYLSDDNIVRIGKQIEAWAEDGTLSSQSGNLDTDKIVDLFRKQGNFPNPFDPVYYGMEEEETS